MRVHYTGQNGLNQALQKKLDARLSKLGKLLDRKEEKEAHVILTSERRLHRAEITVNYYDHQVVGVEEAPDLFPALCGAIDKVEKQLLKHRAKFREKRRGGRVNSVAAEPVVEMSPEQPLPPRVFRVDQLASYKPMTLEEAILAMEGERPYVVYRDAESDRTSVLLRRRDGNFDLIEG
ncbi:MAG: ribosome hibernation-promoting factor, HPF/YfiA family [Bryobacteraceae bacterium]